MYIIHIYQNRPPGLMHLTIQTEYASRLTNMAPYLDSSSSLAALFNTLSKLDKSGFFHNLNCLS